MADIARDGSQIVLKLSIGERIMAVHGDVRVAGGPQPRTRP